MGGYEKKVDELVRQREGEEFWEYAAKTAFQGQPKKWTLQELLDHTEKLNGLFS